METTEKAAGRRAGLATLLRIGVSVALVAWILRKAPVPQVVEAFHSADLRFVLLAAVLNPIGYWASVSRWRLLLRSQGGEASFGFLLRSFLVGVFFNNLLPSTIGGDAVRAVATSRAGVGRGAAVAIVFVDRFLGLLALMLFAVGGVLVSSRLTDRVPALYVGVLAGAVGLGLAAVLLKRIGPAFQGRGSALARAFGLSLVLQVAVVLHYYFLAKALHVPIPLPYFFLIVPLSLFVMMVPVSINAIGVRENVFAFFFAAFGVASVQAVAVAWLDYGLVLLQALVGGAIYAWGRRPAPDVLPAEEVAR